jgi:hypothetical protein
MTDRAMSCCNCEHSWRVPAKPAERPVFCPSCTCHVCACGCGTDLSDMRANALYHSRAHAMALSRAGGASPRAAKAHIVRTAPVADVRAEQEAAEAHWSMTVRECIIDVLRGTGYYHADDLIEQVPDEYRRLISTQTAKLANQKWMVKVGERKSVVKARNAAKSGIYKLTPLGREKLAGVGAGNREGTASNAVATSLAPSTGRAESPAARSSSDADSGEPGAGVLTPQGPEGSPVTPFGASIGSPEPSLFEVPAARPLNPLSDSEAA